MLRANRLKRKLRAGERATGCWLFLAGGDATELLSLCGFDAFIIDHEHIGADLRTLVEQLRAAQASDTAVLVRVPSHDPVYIKRVLDVGVDGIVVPTLETADEARAVVAATRYRPQGGNRGVGYPESRAARWGLAELDYPREYLDELIVAAIVETRRGVENLPEILAVDGIDLIIAGPGDLAADLATDFASLAQYGSYDGPELKRLLSQLERSTRDADRWLGGVARHPGAARGFFERGYDFVTLTADIWLLADGARRALQEAGPTPPKESTAK
jgi:2-keto-3-deoxy-L-rhamnonate aldolase RhmA